MRPVKLVSIFFSSIFFSSIFFSSISLAQSVQGPSDARNFQNVNVCPAGQDSPKPCKRMSKLTYNVMATTTFGATNVVTQGVPELDFRRTSTTCKGTVQAGSSCEVLVEFAPRAPGVRMGAVQLTDSSANLLASTYVYGNGQGPAAAFNPGVSKNLPVSGYNTDAMAADAAGNVYFPANGGMAKFETRTGAQTMVTTSGVPYAFGLAVDGAGNIFFSAGNVFKIVSDTGVQIAVGTNLNAAAGVALDGRGNIYVGDDWDNPLPGHSPWGWPRLAEVSAVTGNEETLLTGYEADPGNPFINFPWGVAVDSAGNAYIACFNYGPVFESIAGTPPDNGGGVYASRQYGVVGGFGNPSAVAVDAAGDVYVVDGGIFEVAPDGSESLVVENPFGGPFGVQEAIDAEGNLFFPSATGYSMTELKASVPATLNFGKIAVGSISAPQSVTIQNIGNQPLNAVAPGLVIGANFQQVPGSGSPADCTASFALAPGASCNLSIVFAPQTTGTIRDTATFKDNALNNAPAASQSVPLEGIGIL